MGQVRHGSATTTHAVRAAIQRSQASLAQDAAFQMPQQCITSSTMDGMDYSSMGQDSPGDGMGPGMMEPEGMNLDAMPEHFQ